MLIVTPADLGTLVRNRRLERDETQVAVARRAAISRDSLIRIEQGHPRVELGKARRKEASDLPGGAPLQVVSDGDE